MTKETFLKQIEGTKFQLDFQTYLSVNNGTMPMAMWNLICSIRDVKLFTIGMKINRHWKLNNVKWYFGVTGGKDKVLQQLEHYKNHLNTIIQEQRQMQEN